MKLEDFYITANTGEISWGSPAKTLNDERISEVARGPLPGDDDLESAISLTRLARDEYELRGTDGNTALSDDQSRVLLRAARMAAQCQGVELKVPWRDFALDRSEFHRSCVPRFLMQPQARRYRVRPTLDEPRTAAGTRSLNAFVAGCTNRSISTSEPSPRSTPTTHDDRSGRPVRPGLIRPRAWHPLGRLRAAPSKSGCDTCMSIPEANWIVGLCHS